MAEDPPVDDELFTAAELARLTNVSATTIKNWTTQHDPPLATVVLHGRSVRFRRRDVLAFCAANPHLRATGKVQQALRSPPVSPPGRAAADTGTADIGTPPEIEALKALARDLRNAADQSVQAMLTGARHAEETARAHREQLEQLAASIAAYDAALSQLTAPSTVND